MIRYILLLLFLIPATTFAQKESDKLKAKQRELQKKIQYTKQLIGNTKNKERLTMTELGIINQQIAYRNELIALYNNQLSQIEHKIKDNEQMILRLEEDLLELKAKYSKLLYFAYKNRDNSDSPELMWFSGEDLNKSYLRMKFLNQIAEYRKLQVQFIKRTQAELKKHQEELARDIASKQQVISSKDAEKKNFENDKSKQKDILSTLKQEEGKLQRELDDAEARKQKLAIAIRKAIEKEIAEQAKKSNNTNSKGFGSTPESIALGKTFASNKGRLPWPVTSGEITGKFGKQAHPVLAGVYTQNNGVDISTNVGSVMRAVFDGKVTSVFVIPGAGKAVMVSHGTYRTVYANLKETYVSKGALLKAKQEIGVLLPTENGKTSEAHFEIWRVQDGNMNKENPAYWLMH